MTLPLLPLASQYIQQIESKIDCDLINIKEWLLANKLSLNITKTEYLVIGSPFNLTSEPNIMIDNVPIKRVTKTKSLGIQIDQFLSWDNHLEEICKKASSGIGAIWGRLFKGGLAQTLG
jgi:hypothetical protein